MYRQSYFHLYIVNTFKYACQNIACAATTARQIVYMYTYVDWPLPQPPALTWSPTL